MIRVILVEPGQIQKRRVYGNGADGTSSRQLLLFLARHKKVGMGIRGTPTRHGTEEPKPQQNRQRSDTTAPGTTWVRRTSVSSTKVSREIAILRSRQFPSRWSTNDKLDKWTKWLASEPSVGALNWALVPLRTTKESANTRPGRLW